MFCRENLLKHWWQRSRRHWKLARFWAITKVGYKLVLSLLEILFFWTYLTETIFSELSPEQAVEHKRYQSLINSQASALDLCHQVWIPFFYSKFSAKFPGNKSPAQRACCENKENEHRFDCSLLKTPNTLWAQSCGNRSAPTTKIIATHSVEQVNVVKPKGLWRRQWGPLMPPPPRPAPSCRQSGL